MKITPRAKDFIYIFCHINYNSLRQGLRFGAFWHLLWALLIECLFNGWPGGFMRFLHLSLVLATFMAIGFMAAPAKADLLVEPYAGYELGTLNLSYGSGAGITNSGQSFQNSQTGFDLGVRLGYEFPLIFVALDGMYTSGNVASGSGTGAFSSSSMTRTSVFIDAGVHLLFIRGYVGYGFVDNTAISTTLSPSFTGNAIKLGVSFTGIPFIDINLEYIMHSLTNYSISNDPGSYYSNSGKDNVAMLSVSVPFLF
jgi:hypothetical protein